MAARRRVPPLAAGTATATMVALFAATLAGSAPARSAAPIVVRVTARDFSFALSRRAVPAGSTVRFVVRNRGSNLHDFVVDGRRTRKLQPGKSQTITVKFPKKGTFRFLCSVPGHARLGMKGAFGVGAAPPPTKAPPPITVADTAVLTKVATTEQPVLVTSPPGDTDRAFIVEQTGVVKILRDGQVLPKPFLDIRDRVTNSGESGLLSIAFAPDYAQSGLVYAFYNSRSGSYADTHISEFRRSASDPDVLDPASERVLITIPKPYADHNGGMLQFGPDGDLYASVGDGDPGVLNRAGIFAQRLDLLLGKILRLDPRNGNPYAVPRDNPFSGVAGARPEIWAYGLRNPWRFWIDDATGDMVIGDVGSTSAEELNLIRRGTSGQDFGWPCFEGSLVFDPTVACDRPVAPILAIPHENGVCALVGGVVAHDPRIPALQGRYLYGDLCTGRLTAVAIQNGRVAASDDLGLVVPATTSFGVDGLGRVYVTAAGGEVYRLDPRP